MSAVTPPRTSTPNVPPDLRRRLVPPRRDAGKAGEVREVRRRFVRRRLGLAGLLATALAITAAVVLVASGSGEAPPATGAAKLVPANALAYVNLSTDPARAAVKRARALVARFPDWPLLATVALNRLDAIVGGSSGVDFATEIRPWLGKEAALALIAQGAAGSAAPLVVLDVARPGRARAFVTRAGATAAGAYDGVPIRAYPSGTELAFAGQYLVAGSAAAVRAAIDADRGRTRSLANDPAYQRVAADEPPERVLDAYLPAAGVRSLLAARLGLAGALGVLLDRPSLRGVAISVSPNANGARVLVHRALSAGGRATSFTPSLQSLLPSGSTLMLDVAGLDRAAPTLLRAAATAGIAGNVGPLLRRLGAALRTEGVNVGRALSLFSGETAVAIAPGSTPALLIVARVRDEAAARNELASLEAPMTTLFSSSGSQALQVPELADHEVAGATVHELQLGPGLQVDFGVFNGVVVLSTSVQAIDAVAQHSRGLVDDAAYKATLPDRPDQLSSLLFADFSRVLQLGEQMGMTSGTRIREFLPDVSKIRAIGLSSTSSATDTTAELSLEIR